MDFAEQNSEVIASLLYMRRPELVRTLAAGTDPEEMYYSFDDMARRNNGLWRTFRQAQYLWARVTAARYLHGGAEADAWARRLAWYDEDNPHQLLTQFFLPIVRRTLDVRSNQKYYGAFVLLDVTGVLALASFSVKCFNDADDVPLTPRWETTRTRFVRKSSIFPRIVANATPTQPNPQKLADDDDTVVD